MALVAQQRWPRPARRTATALFVVAWSLLGVAGLAELFLAGFAERRVAAALGPEATGVDVRVAARPAVKLLLGRADAVDVRVDEMRTRAGASGGDGLGDLIARTGASGRIDARVRTLVTPRLTLRDVRLVKRGDRLSARATVTRGAIEAALPSNFTLAARPGSGAFGLTVTARVLGRSATADATVAASGGRLVIAPELRGVRLLVLTLFSDPRVSVDRIRATVTAGGYRFEAEGHLT